MSSSKCWHFILVSSGLDVPFLLAPVVGVAVTVVSKSVVSIPGISLGISSGLSISRSLAVVVVVGVAVVSAVVTTKTVVAIHQVGVGLGVSSGGPRHQQTSCHSSRSRGSRSVHHSILYSIQDHI